MQAEEAQLVPGHLFGVLDWRLIERLPFQRLRQDIAIRSEIMRGIIKCPEQVDALQRFFPAIVRCPMEGFKIVRVRNGCDPIPDQVQELPGDPMFQ